MKVKVTQSCLIQPTHGLYSPWHSPGQNTGLGSFPFSRRSSQPRDQTQVKPTFSLSSFTLIKKLFSFSLLSAISVVSSAYLRLLIFLPAIFIPACASSILAFCLMYSAYKLNKQSDNIQPWCTPFPIWNQSVGPCPVLTVSSWPAYRFLKRQVTWSGLPISFRIFHSLL